MEEEKKWKRESDRGRGKSKMNRRVFTQWIRNRKTFTQWITLASSQNLFPLTTST